MGSALSTRPRDEFVLSTKVGRLVRAAGDVHQGDEVDRQALGERSDAYFADTGGRRVVFDYSADGVRRSIEESLERLGLTRIDIVYIHDPDEHWQAALEEAYPALDGLRAGGVVGAIGVGMNQSAMLARFARETDIDVILLANRYTLLDQDALAELLPLCLDRGIAVVVGGVMNSGILVDPRPGSRYDYGPAPAAIIERARRIGAACDRHGVSRQAAGIQFPLAHPAVTGLIAGVRTPEHLDDYPAGMRQEIPVVLWTELKAEGLIAADAPTPQ
jgi:D-threo-aldose 1-dehydrogenase